MRSVAVIVDTADPGRAAEALRAAVGLTLRGAQVSVTLLHHLDRSDARLARPLSTLRALGHSVDAPLPAALSSAAIEVWT